MPTIEEKINAITDDISSSIKNEGALQLEVLSVPVTTDAVKLTTLQAADLLAKNQDIMDELIATAIPPEDEDELIESGPEIITLKGLGGISSLGKWKSAARRRSDSHKHKINSMMATGATPAQLASANKKYKEDKKKAKKAIITAIVIAVALVVTAGVILPALSGGGAVAGGAAAAGGTGAAAAAGGSLSLASVTSTLATVGGIASSLKESPSKVVDNIIPGASDMTKSLTGKTPEELLKEQTTKAKKQTQDISTAFNTAQETGTPFVAPVPVGASVKKSYLIPVLVGGGVVVTAAIIYFARKGK